MTAFAKCAAASGPASPSPLLRAPEKPCASGGAWSRLATVAGPLQAKLTVNTPGDVHEQEADHVADQVLRMPDPDASAGRVAAPQIQRMCADCEEEGKVQRALPQMEEEEKMQAKETPGAVPEVGPRTEARISAMQGGGAPLSPDLRGYFEPRLGQDLSAVRLHTGGEAEAAAGEVQARAFTVGPNIAFAAGEFRPHSDSGKRLLAHELVHSVQQGASQQVRRTYHLSDLQSSTSRRGVALRRRPSTYFFAGSTANTTDRKAMVVAGIHGNEPSAIALGGEVKNQLISGTLTPDFHTLLVPRANPTRDRSTSRVNDLNREYGGSTPSPEPIAREIESMVTEFEPERILSIHAISRSTLGGLYLDPVRAAGTAPLPTGTASERQSAFTGDARNAAGMQLTEELIDEVRADPAGVTATAGNDPGTKAVGPASNPATLSFPASDRPGGTGASPYSLIYPQTQQIASGSSGGGRTSLGEWASQLPSGPSVITLEVPGKSIQAGGSNWRPFLPAVRRFLQIPGASSTAPTPSSTPTSSSTTPSSAPSSTPAPTTPTLGTAPRSVAPMRKTGRVRGLQRAPLSEKDLSKKKGIPLTFLQEVYRRQVAIWTVRGASYVHEVPAADRVSLPSSDVIKPVSVHKDVSTAVSNLLAAARKDLAAAGGTGNAADVKDLRVRSGYRSATSQFSIWEREVPKYYRDTKKHRSSLKDGEHGEAAAQYLAEYINQRVFSPGYSPHQRGKTVDLTYLSKTEWPDATGNWAPADTTPAAIATWSASWFYQWLKSNAASFGFVPNPSVNEPWHWEFQPKKVGAAAASGIFYLLRLILDILWKILQILLGKDPREEPDAEAEAPPSEAPEEPGSEEKKPSADQP